MTKAICERNHLIGVLFTVSKGHSMTIMVESMAAASKPGYGVEAEGS